MLRVDVERTREGVRRLQRRDDPLGLREPLERGERLLVGAGEVDGAALVAEERVLRPDARVVEPGGDRVRVGDLPVVVGEDRRPRAVEHALPARAEARRACRFDADQPHVRVVDEALEHPDRVRAAAHAGDDDLGQAALDLEELLPRLVPDHRLKLADHLRVRRGADAGADQVVRVLDVRDPVADRLARCLLQRARPELDGPHLGAEEVHALDVRLLAPHVLGAHVDDAVEPEAGADGRGRDPVLAGAGLGDDAALAQALGEDGLAERVVELVRAGVEDVLALEVDGLLRREPVDAGERRGAARVGPREVAELVLERLVRPGRAPARGELVEGGDQGLGDEPSAVRAVRERAHARAAWTNALTRAWSFRPGSRSRLDAASTAHGSTRRTTSATFSGPSFPASMSRPFRARASS